MTETPPPLPESGAPPVTFVISMRKTGTQTVFRSLRDQLPSKVFHTHFLDGKLRDHPSGDNEAVFAIFNRQLKALRALARRKSPQLIVTIVRDPVARCYSDLFYSETGAIGEALEAGRIGQVADLVGAAAEREAVLQESYYRDELPVIGIDVASLPPAVNGYSTAEVGGRSVLVFRLEDLDDALPRATEALLGVRVAATRKNPAAKRGPEAVYDALRRVPMPAALVADLYRTKAIARFYSAQEIANMKAFWDERWERRRRA